MSSADTQIPVIENSSHNSSSDAIHENKRPMKNLLNFNTSQQKLFWLGSLLALMCAFSQSSASAVIKFSTISVQVLLVIASSFLVLISVFIMAYKRENFLGSEGETHLLVVRGLAATGMIWGNFSVKFISLTETYIILSTAPFFSLVFSRIFLKEDFGIYEGLVCLMSISGVIVIMDPEDIAKSIEEEVSLQNRIIGATLALVTAISVALANVCMRKLKHIHFSVVMFWGGFFNLFISIALIFTSNSLVVPNTFSDGAIAVGYATLVLIKYFLNIVAMKYITAGTYSIIYTSSVVFAILYQEFLFQSGNILTTVTGTFLVIFSILLITKKEWILVKFFRSKFYENN